jgi:hypothetical protein
MGAGNFSGITNPFTLLTNGTVTVAGTVPDTLPDTDNDKYYI